MTDSLAVTQVLSTHSGPLHRPGQPRTPSHSGTTTLAGQTTQLDFKQFRKFCEVWNNGVHYFVLLILGFIQFYCMFFNHFILCSRLHKNWNRFGVVIWQNHMILVLFIHIICSFTWTLMSRKAANKTVTTSQHREADVEVQDFPNSRGFIDLDRRFWTKKLSGNRHDGLPASSQCLKEKCITKRNRSKHTHKTEQHPTVCPRLKLWDVCRCDSTLHK